METIIGLLAGLLTTGAFLPQIIKTWRTKDVSGISLGMYLIYLLGVVTWFFYAFLIGEVAIVITNCFSLLFGLIMIIFKIKYQTSGIR